MQNLLVIPFDNRLLKKLSRPAKRSSSIFLVLSCLMLVSFLCLYIIQANALVKDTYMAHLHQEQARKLLQENKSLEYSFSQNNSLSQAHIKALELNFEKVTSISYIQISDIQMVAR